MPQANRATSLAGRVRPGAGRATAGDAAAPERRIVTAGEWNRHAVVESDMTDGSTCDRRASIVMLFSCWLLHYEYGFFATSSSLLLVSLAGGSNPANQDGKFPIQLTRFWDLATDGSEDRDERHTLG